MAMNDDNLPPVLPPAPFPIKTTVTIFVAVAVMGVFLNFNSSINLWASKINPQTLEFYKAVLTVIVALIAAGIAATIQWRQAKTAHNQWRTAQQKLNLDLFDRRFKIYMAAMDLGYKLQEAPNELPVIDAYIQIIDPSEWLFNETISKRIGVRYIKIIKLKLYEKNKAAEAAYSENGSSELIETSKKLNSEYWAWYSAERKSIKIMCEPYLKLDQI